MSVKKLIKICIPQEEIVENVYKEVYVAPLNKSAIFNLIVGNRKLESAIIRVAAGFGEAPSLDDHILYGEHLRPDAIIECPEIVCPPGRKIWIRTTVAGLSIKLYGFVEDIENV